MGTSKRLALATLCLLSVGGIFYLGRHLSGWNEATLYEIRTEKARRRGIAFDSRTPLQVLNDRRGNNSGAWPAYAPSLVFDSPPASDTGEAILPLGGVPHATISMCNESGSYSRYRNDRFGFHNPDGLHDRPIERILLGDSFLLGACVPDGKEFAALMRNEVPGTLSLGSVRSGPLVYLATLKEHGFPAPGGKVVWFHFEGNDLRDLRAESRHPRLLAYLRTDHYQNLRERGEENTRSIERSLEREIERATREARPQTARSGLRVRALASLDEWLPRLVKFVDILNPDELISEEILTLYGRVLREAKRVAESRGAKFHVVYLPDWAGLSGLAKHRLHPRRVRSLLTESGISWLDLEPVFRSQPDPLALFPFRINGHYTEAGHALVAKKALEFLRAAPTNSKAPDGPVARLD